MSEGAGLATAFAALGDDTRWEILQRLGAAPSSASTLADQLPVSRQAIARHLEVLRRSGLVEAERHGHEVRYVPVGARLSALSRELEERARLWERRLRTIKRLAEDG